MMLLLNNLKYIIAIPFTIFLQVAIFNNIDFWGFSNPYFYIIIVLLYPLNNNRYIFLLLAFILGISIDLLEFTGGVNAFATVFIAYIRHYLVKLIYPTNTYEEEDIYLSNFKFIHWVMYLTVLIYLHNFLVDFMESFNPSRALDIAINASVGSVITLILITVYLTFFPVQRNSEF